MATCGKVKCGLTLAGYVICAPQAGLGVNSKRIGIDQFNSVILAGIGIEKFGTKLIVFSDQEKLYNDSAFQTLPSI